MLSKNVYFNNKGEQGRRGQAGEQEETGYRDISGSTSELERTMELKAEQRDGGEICTRGKHKQPQMKTSKSTCKIKNDKLRHKESTLERHR